VSAEKGKWGYLSNKEDERDELCYAVLLNKQTNDYISIIIEY